MRNAWMLAVVLLGACAGDEVDMGASRCTGALYDRCTNEHECMSQDCRPVGNEQMCSQPCSAQIPCPDLDGVPVTCNAGGICEPSAPRQCMPE